MPAIFMKGLFWPVVCSLPVLLLMMKQQDFGTTAIMGTILLAIMFVAGVRMTYLIPLLVFGFTGLIIYAISTPERWARILAWWSFVQHPEHVVVGSKFWQQLQGLIALGSGGLSGLGLGNSRQKMYWLPEVNTDFVFPIIGEELGMWITLAVVMSFLLLMLCSGWITIHAPDPAGVMLGTGPHADDRPAGPDESRGGNVTHAVQGYSSSFYQLWRFEFTDMSRRNWHSLQYAPARNLPGADRAGGDADVV